MRRVFTDTVLTAGGVLLIAVVLAAFDVRVREQASELVRGGRPTAEIVSAGEQAHSLLVAVLQTARDQSLEHAPLMIFILAATVLVLFMLRT